MHVCTSTCQVLNGLWQPTVRANSGWSFVGSTSSLITNLSPCSGWAAVPEGLDWVGVRYPWVSKPGGADRLDAYGIGWDWRNLRFLCFLCVGCGIRVGSSMPARKLCSR